MKLIYWRRQLATSEFHLYFRLYALDLRDCMRKHAAANTHLAHIAIMRMACGLCAGLGFVHSRHVIHRDLKPRNILLRREMVQPAANPATSREEDM